ncbi:MAG: DUF5925 domain-containing protein [Actinomycetota bacterium]
MTDAAPTRSSAPRTTSAFTLIDDATPFRLTRSFWAREVWASDLSTVLDQDWYVDGSGDLLERLPEDTTVLRHTASERWQSAVLEVAGTLVFVALYGGNLEVSVAGRDANAARACLARLKDLFPEAEPPTEQVIPITFWHHSDGPHSSRRNIEVPDWSEVAANYTEEPTRRELERLMRDFSPSAGGRVLLWHGEPGTGKTYAIRALAWEWREWAEFHYVVDPEVAFGQSAEYLLRLALHNEQRKADTNRWRVLVLEDTGEMLTADAKDRVGQSLSRLLNLGDGLMGQGLNLLLLLTSNEPLARIHPAVARPGRCAAQVEFGPLTREESEKWLADHGAPDRSRSGPATLAELHAALNGAPVRERPTVGFARA